MESGSEAADRPTSAGICHLVFGGALAAAVALTGCSPKLSPAPQLQPPMPIHIEDAAAVELRIEAPPDSPVLIAVSAGNVDVKAAVVGDDPASLRYCDASNRRMGVETLLIEPPHATSINIRVERNDHSRARGEARLEAQALPLVTQPDHARLAAARADAAACLAFPNLASKDRAAAGYAAAAAAWADAGDQGRRGLALLHEAGVRYLRNADWQASADLAADAYYELEQAGRMAHAAYALRLEGAALDQLANAANYDLRLREATVERAQERLTQAAERFDRLDMPYEAGYALSYRGVSRAEAGDMSRASADFQAALDRFRAAGDGPAQAIALQSLAHQNFEAGLIQVAVRQYEQALALIPRGEEPANYAHTLHNSALALRVLGRFDEAMEREYESAGLLHGLGDRDGEARALQALGLILMSMGEVEQAVEPLQAAYTMRGEGGVRREQAITLLNLAEIERQLGRYRSAIDLDRRALGMLVAPHERVRALLSLARDYTGIGDRQGARLQLESILALGLPGTHRQLALAHAELAVLESQDNRPDQAEEHFRRAVSIQETNGADVDLAQTLQKRAAARLESGDAAGALEDATAALTRFEAVGVQGLHAEARAAFRAAHRDAVELRIAALLTQANSARTADAVEASRLLRAAFNTSDRAQAQLLAETARPNGQSIPNKLLDERQLVYEQLAARRQRYDQLLESADPGHERAQVLMREIELLRAQARLLEAQVARVATGAGRPAPARPEQPLPAGVRVAEFFIGRQHAWLFVVEANQVRVHVLPPPSEIASDARTLHQSWRHTTRDGGDRLAAGRRLAMRIFGPLGTAAQGAKLLIVPDGALHLVPVSLLATMAWPALDPGAAIIIPSVATLMTPAATGASPTDVLAIIADPVYESSDPRIARSLYESPAGEPPPLQVASGRAALRRLPATAIEARELAALANDATRTLFLLGSDASRYAVMRAPLERYRFIHFATHAFADARDPALARLALSNYAADGRPVDGALRLYDITRLRFHADLVVLSGCDTALGREIAGEAPIGLSQAFLRSGARAVVATLWQVPDSSTAVLMREFYRQMLEQERSVPDALARAQLFLRRQQRWKDPYYWAGFQLVSNASIDHVNYNVTGREEPP